MGGPAEPIAETAYRARITQDGRVRHSRAYSTRAPAARAGTKAVRDHAASVAHDERIAAHYGRPPRDFGPPPSVAIEVAAIQWTEEAAK